MRPLLLAALVGFFAVGCGTPPPGELSSKEGEATEREAASQGESSPSDTIASHELPIVSAGDRLIEAADFELTALDGQRMSLSSFESPVVLLHFWSKYRSCIDDLQTLQRLHEKYEPQGVKIVGLAYSSGSREEVEGFLDDHGVDFPTLMCSTKVVRAYDVATYPTTFVLDDQKHIRYWMYGILVEDHWDQLISEMLDGGNAAATGD